MVRVPHRRAKSDFERTAMKTLVEFRSHDFPPYEGGGGRQPGPLRQATRGVSCPQATEHGIRAARTDRRRLGLGDPHQERWVPTVDRLRQPRRGGGCVLVFCRTAHPENPLISLLMDDRYVAPRRTTPDRARRNPVE